LAGVFEGQRLSSYCQEHFFLGGTHGQFSPRHDLLRDGQPPRRIVSLPVSRVDPCKTWHEFGTLWPDHAAAETHHSPRRKADVDPGLAVISDEHSHELFAGIHLTAIDRDADGAVGVLQVAVDAIGSDVHKAADVAVSQESVVLLI